MRHTLFAAQFFCSFFQILVCAHLSWWLNCDVLWCGMVWYAVLCAGRSWKSCARFEIPQTPKGLQISNMCLKKCSILRCKILVRLERCCNCAMLFFRELGEQLFVEANVLGRKTCTANTKPSWQISRAPASRRQFFSAAGRAPSLVTISTCRRASMPSSSFGYTHSLPSATSWAARGTGWAPTHAPGRLGLAQIGIDLFGQFCGSHTALLVGRKQPEHSQTAYNQMASYH